MNPDRYDYVVLGAGIVGLSIARELVARNPGARILVLEKEDRPGRHASGRNSGVLHSGIYYPSESLKAKVCAEGAKAMAAYCQEHGLPILKVGKVIVPTRIQDDSQVDLLYRRAQDNGVRIRLINAKELAEIEPEARTASNRALHSPDTAVIDPLVILDHIRRGLEQAGVAFRYDCPCSGADPDRSLVFCREERFRYGHLYNAAGAYADRIAKMFGVGEQYTLLPFKGRYLKLRADAGIHIRGLIYPVPNLEVPFLGVHSVRNIKGDSYFGPSAMPALGRENYHGLDGFSLQDSVQISRRLLEQYWFNQQGFRKHLFEEARRLLQSAFAADAQRLVPRVTASALMPCDKVGIRPQLLDIEKHRLVMDFLVDAKDNTTHVLNAISPAFTSAFSFAKLVVEGRQLASR